MNNTAKRLDSVFHALADSTRREILRRVASREYTISELAEPFKMTLAAVSKHIKVLEKAGLLTRSIDGRIHRCAMNAEPLTEASNLIRYYQEFWEGRLNALEKFLEETADEKPTEKKTPPEKK